MGFRKNYARPDYYARYWSEVRRRGSIPALVGLSIFGMTTEVVGETGSTQQEKVLRISPRLHSQEHPLP
jgi:hypothetical protein